MRPHPPRAGRLLDGLDVRPRAYDERAVVYVAVIVALLALAFTITSFWWLHARSGALEAARPQAYAFADNVRLLLPLAFFNTGARALLVSDLRVVIDDQSERMPLAWIATRSVLQPGADDGYAFATPFAVQGRNTREIIGDFGDDHGWTPAPGSRHTLRLQALVHPSEAWIDITTFEWWAPLSAELMHSYIAHRNAPPQQDAPDSPT